MPTYDYLCEKCKKGFELFQSMKDAPITVCPENLCRQRTWGKGTVKRQLGTGAGLIFKGSGFYITDYRSEGYKEAAKKETSGSSSETKTSEAKPAETKTTESKPTETKKTESKPAAAEKAKSSAKKK
jgi:putative FmdB family regulatory protein